MPSGCGNGAYDKAISYGYDLGGNLTSEGDGTGVVYTYGRSPAGEITGITSSLSDAKDPANIITPGSPQNGPFSPNSLTLGNGLSSVKSYDSSGRNNGNWVYSGTSAIGCQNGGTLYANSVNYSGSRVTYIADNVLAMQQNAGYDEFNRLTSITATNVQHGLSLPTMAGATAGDRTSPRAVAPRHSSASTQATTTWCRRATMRPAMKPTMVLTAIPTTPMVTSRWSMVAIRPSIPTTA